MGGRLEKEIKEKNMTNLLVAVVINILTNYSFEPIIEGYDSDYSCSQQSCFLVYHCKPRHSKTDRMEIETVVEKTTLQWEDNGKTNSLVMSEKTISQRERKHIVYLEPKTNISDWINIHIPQTINWITNTAPYDILTNFWRVEINNVNYPTVLTNSVHIIH